MADSTSSGFSPEDSEYMSIAFQLAERGRYTAHPNPRVGCVIVKDNGVIGRGWHRLRGEAHAEVNALADAGPAAAGATAYVTLEPCAHTGRTPPCVDSLINAGIREVVCALEDPDPRVSGGGFAALRAAQVTVRTGLMQARGAHLIRGFIKRVKYGRPFVRVKMAASLDGATAMKDGESQWITGTSARLDVQRLRAESGAVLTGIGTVLADDPSLTVRDASLTTRQPLRVVVDSKLRMPASSIMLGLDGATVVFCAADADDKALRRWGAEVLSRPAADGTVNLEKVLDWLGDNDINDVLVEAGSGLAGAFLAQKLADELVIYQAPHIMGSETRGMFTTPGWRQLADRAELTITDVRQVGGDTRITASL